MRPYASCTWSVPALRNRSLLPVVAATPYSQPKTSWSNTREPATTRMTRPNASFATMWQLVKKQETSMRSVCIWICNAKYAGDFVDKIWPFFTFCMSVCLLLALSFILSCFFCLSVSRCLSLSFLPPSLLSPSPSLSVWFLNKNAFFRKLFSAETEKENHACAPPEPFPCEMCEKVYTTRGALKFHIESLHKG